MSKYIIALKSLLSKTNLSAAIFSTIVSPRFWFWYKQMLNTSTMQMMGSLASCYLSLLCSRPPFLWLCQGTVIKGICLCRYKQQPCLTGFPMTYLQSSSQNIVLPLFLHNTIFQSRDGKNLWYQVNTKKTKVTKAVILSYKCLVRFDWWVAECVQRLHLRVMLVSDQMHVFANFLLVIVKCIQSGQANEIRFSSQLYKASEIQLVFNHKCSNTI